MALIAVETRVLAIENEASLTMIEAFLRWLPSDKRELGAVMFRVALNASRIARTQSCILHMQTVVLLQL